MKAAIVVTTHDLAGMNIKSHLVEKGFTETHAEISGHKILENLRLNAKLYTFDKHSVDLEQMDKSIEDNMDADLIIFATTHTSKNGTPVLSAHCAGNWGVAELGGKDKYLCLSPASYIKEALIRLNKLNTLGWEVVQEATHHGPEIKKPSFFIEIGSSKTEWVNPEAGRIISDVLIDLLKNPPKEYRSAVGIGGLHTMPNFMKIVFDSDIAIGHLCPKYNLDNLDKEMLEQAIKQTVPKATMIIFDWKGLGEHKERLKSIVDELDIEVKRTKNF